MRQQPGREWVAINNQTSSLALRILAALLSFAVLIQFFIAGMAAMTNPEWWTYHGTWVGIFRWLVVPLPILAFIGEQPRYWRSLIQIALQYVWHIVRWRDDYRSASAFIRSMVPCY